MATKEFSTTNHLGQKERFTPQRVTYNGQAGYFWTRAVLQKGAWIHQGRAFHGAKATRKEIA